MTKKSAYNPVVYRLHDASGRLLYIGSTIRLKERLTNHGSVSWWHGLAERIEVTKYPTLAEARTAEVEAIRSERPAFNSTENGGRFYELTADDLAACRRWVHRSGWCRSGTLPPWLRWIDDGLEDGTKGHNQFGTRRTVLAPS